MIKIKSSILEVSGLIWKRASHHRLDPQLQHKKFQIMFFPPTAGQIHLSHYLPLSKVQNADTNGED